MVDIAAYRKNKESDTVDTTTVMNLISVKRSELEHILTSGKNLLNKDVLSKSVELDKAILTYMSDCPSLPAQSGK